MRWFVPNFRSPRTPHLRSGRGYLTLNTLLPMHLSSRWLSLLLATSAAAAAQTAPPAAPAATNPGPITTAEKVVVIEELLTESPATVSEIELQTLPQSAQTTRHLSDRAANFFIGTNDAHSFNDVFSLRGLANTPIFGAPAISFCLDDLPLGSPFTFPTELAGFTRAELHRGPTQNTVFGRAGSAGVVTLATPEPGATPMGEVRLSFGNYDARGAAVSASSAAGGRADAYVSAAYSEREGYITNATLRRDIDAKESLSGLARLRFRPRTGAEITFLGTALRARDGTQPLVPLGGPLFSVSRTMEGETNVDAYNAALGAAFDTTLGRLSATTSFNQWELGPYNSVLDFGFAELNNLVNQKQRNWNEEIKLASDQKNEVRWHAGVFFSDGRTDGAFRRLFGPMVFEDSVYRIDSRDLAAFGEATFRAAPALYFTAGLRAEGSRKEMRRQEFAPVPQTFTLERESTALLPKLGLNFALSDRTNAFATAGAGYKPGGFSAFTGNRALAAFGPERTKTGEAGLTHTAADKRVAATARAFWYDITGYQIERSFATGAPTGDDYLVVNAPRARSYGGELELAWRPLTGLTLAADVGVTRVTLREFRDPYTGTSYSGNRAPYVPNYDASVRAEYQSALGWFIAAELTRNGTTYYTEAEDLMFGQKAYTLLGARLGYAADRWRVTAFGENLDDRGYYSAITPGTFHGTPGAPRTYGVEVALKW